MELINNTTKTLRDDLSDEIKDGMYFKFVRLNIPIVILQNIKR